MCGTTVKVGAGECVYMWVCTCGCVHVVVYMWVCTCGCVHVGVYLWVCTCGCVHVVVYMWVCRCGVYTELWYLHSAMFLTLIHALNLLNVC